VFAGTLVAQGQGTVRVRATGSFTEMGQIGRSLEQIVLPSSPLRDEMTRLTQRIAAVGVVLALLLVLAYWIMRDNLPEAILAGIALAMSLLPQEFPVIMIIFFAFAARRLGKLDVLTRRLDAIETLGETSVLCVDKTGTLTQNRMQVVALHPGDGATLEQSAVGTAAHETALSPAQQTLLQHALLASETLPHDGTRVRAIAATARNDPCMAYRCHARRCGQGRAGISQCLVQAERRSARPDQSRRDSTRRAWAACARCGARQSRQWCRLAAQPARFCL
jgi:magnesium-transporting ATPase (P-type)